MTTLVWWIHRAFGFVVDVLIWPVQTSVWGSLVWLSAIFGVLFLIVFGKVSNQAALRAAKDKLKAHFLELWLYRDDLVVTGRSLGRILATNLRYVAINLQPILVLAPIFVLIALQFDLRYQRDPLPVGGETVLTVRLRQGVDVRQVQLDVPPGALSVVTPAVKVPSRGEVAWRLHADRAGTHELRVRVGDARTTKLVSVGQPVRKNPERRSTRLMDVLMNPGEPPLAPPFREIALTYPGTGEFYLGTWAIHWLITFLVVSLAAALVAKGPLGIEI